jgi:hypothetical protein
VNTGGRRASPIVTIPRAQFVSTHRSKCIAMGGGVIIVYNNRLSEAERRVVVDGLRTHLPQAHFMRIGSPEVVEACPYAGPGLVPIHEPDRVVWVQMGEAFDQCATLGIVKQVVRPIQPYTVQIIAMPSESRTFQPRAYLYPLDAMSPAEMEELRVRLERLDFVQWVEFSAQEIRFTIMAPKSALLDRELIIHTFEELGFYIVPSLPRTNI